MENHYTTMHSNSSNSNSPNDVICLGGSVKTKISVNYSTFLSNNNNNNDERSNNSFTGE